MDSECIVCHMRQSLDVCRFVNAEEAKRQEVLQWVMEILLERDAYDQGEIGFIIRNEVKRILDLRDPYQVVKDESIRQSLGLYPRLKELVRESKQPLKRAVEIALAGNVIDVGPSSSYDMERAVLEVLQEAKHHFDWDAFQREIQKAEYVLMLGDNAGETVFDRVLIEEISRPVKYAVKSEPVLNDAVLEDAVASGLDKVAEIVENGSPMSGTVLSRCSREFLELYADAPMVISKGQANFESLAVETRRIFFLFKVKCDLLARTYDLPLNEYVLLDNRNFR